MVWCSKKSIHATERDSEANRQKREEFLIEVSQIAAEDLIYLDESGVSTQRIRTDARASRITADGASLLYLPPLLAQLLPDRKAWFQLKQDMRTAQEELLKHSTPPSPRFFQRSHKKRCNRMVQIPIRRLRLKEN